MFDHEIDVVVGEKKQQGLRPAVRLADGSFIIGEGFTLDLAQNEAVYRFDIACTEKFIGLGVCLMKPDDSIWREAPFSGGSQQVFPGDTLKLTYTIIVHGDNPKLGTPENQVLAREAAHYLGIGPFA